MNIITCAQPFPDLGLYPTTLSFDQGGHTIGEEARRMIEDVHGAIFDLVQLIKTFQSKNKLSRLLTSTLFKQRQEELDAVVNQAIMRLQVIGIQPFAQLRSRWWCSCLSTRGVLNIRVRDARLVYLRELLAPGSFL